MIRKNDLELPLAAFLQLNHTFKSFFIKFIYIYAVNIILEINLILKQHWSYFFEIKICDIIFF